MTKKLIALILGLLMLTLLTCGFFPRLPILSNAITPASTPTEITSPTVSPPTPTPLPASPTPILPEPTDTAVEVNLPKVNFDDLAPYRQAMLPEFMGDVAQVAARGATQYHLAVQLESDSFNNEAGLNLNGVQHIRYTNTEEVPLTEIYLRLYPNLPGYGGHMEVNSVVVAGQAVQPILEANTSALKIPFNSPLVPGNSLDLRLEYRALVPTRPGQGYNIFAYNRDTVALAGFYPTIAVYDDEGWNIEIPPAYGDATYLDVALYQVELTVPEQMVVAASGNLITQTVNSDKTKTLFLASGPMRDFYAVMRVDYQIVSEMVDGILVSSYYPPDLQAGGILALQYAVDALRVFNERFGPYPYAEFDIAATPTTAGGVEYPGIVVVTQNVYLQEGGFFQHASAHEVAHQWWYGLVGNDQVDEPWLDEALTNYSTAIYWQMIEGDEVGEQVINNFFVAPYEQAKTHGTDRAVIGSVRSFSEGEYGRIVYGKGPLFFEALRTQVGDKIYFKIMQTYYSEYKYKIARAEDLFDIIERVSEQEIDSLSEQWLQTP